MTHPTEGEIGEAMKWVEQPLDRVITRDLPAARAMQTLAAALRQAQAEIVELAKARDNLNKYNDHLNKENASLKNGMAHDVECLGELTSLLAAKEAAIEKFGVARFNEGYDVATRQFGPPPPAAPAQESEREGNKI